VQTKIYKASCSEIKEELSKTSKKLKAATSEQAALAERNANLETWNNVLQKQKDTLWKVKERVSSTKMAAVEKAKRVRLKEKGVISDSTRDKIRELIKFGVPVEHVEDVFWVVAEEFGIIIDDRISARSVSLVILEGGIAAKLKIAHEIINTDGE
jgi:hypothetical protein